MSCLLMEKLLRHRQSVRSSEGCCVDRLNSPGYIDRSQEGARSVQDDYFLSR
jgi:hypothetical protein